MVAERASIIAGEGCCSSSDHENQLTSPINYGASYRTVPNFILTSGTELKNVRRNNCNNKEEIRLGTI